MKNDETKIKNTRIKTPTIYQMEATECGAASLGMVLAYYGCYIPLEQLRIDCGVSKNGCNAKNVKKAAIQHGLKTRGYGREAEDLIEMKPPLILYWEYNHFLVYEGYANGFFYLNDPAVGKRKMTLEEMDESFAGICLSFEVGEDFVRNSKGHQVYNIIKERLSGSRRDVLGILIAGLILSVTGIVIPVFSQVFIDDILIGENTSWLGSLILIMIFTAVFQIVFMHLRSKLLNKLQLKLKMISGYDFLGHLFKLPIAFFEQRFAGDLVQRVDNNNSVNEFISGNLAESILNIIMTILYLIILLFYSPLLTLIGVAGIALNLTVVAVASRSLESFSTKVEQDEGNLAGTIYSGMSVYDTLKASGAESMYVARTLGYYAKYCDGEQKIGRRAVVLSTAPSMITQVFDVIILMVGGLLAIDGNITVGVLVGFTELLGAFTAPINSMAGSFQDMQQLKADISRVKDIEDYEAAPQFDEEKEHIGLKRRLSGRVELKNVSFGYSRLDPPLIENFSFVLEPGRSIALVGASGSGKSTVGKLISGLNDPWSGEVLFDGIPIRDIQQEDFTGNVTTVSQDIIMFAASIRDNLTLWNENTDDEYIVSAAKDACIHDAIVNHPGAYDYKMHEGGNDFSGGQRQRLEIARALVTNPSVVVLDEATSALDVITEQKVMDNIKRRGCSCVIIAHRLSTIRGCDEIIVMDEGRIVQRGTHDEMKDVDGPYRSLIAAE